MRWAWVVIGLILILCIALPALADDTHISTASIFELGVSARTLGMGGTFIALADDEAAVFYNPAGLPQLSKTKLSSLYTRPFSVYSYGALGAAEQNWGGYFLILDSDTLEERDLYGNTIGSFRYTSTGIIGGWGRSIKENFSIGLQVKGYHLVTLTKGYGLSLSPAVLYKRGAYTTGIIWRNLLSTGTNYEDGHTEPWIHDLAIGLAWQREKFTCSLDFTENLITRGDISCMRMGYEYTGFDPIVLRAGTNRDWTSFGASISWKGLQIDFAYLLHYALPDTYVVSLSYQGTGSFTSGVSQALNRFSRKFKQAF